MMSNNGSVQACDGSRYPAAAAWCIDLLPSRVREGKGDKAEKVDLIGHDRLEISARHDPARVLALLREANHDWAGRNAGGCVWLFQLGDGSGDPCLAVGVRGDVGALTWYAKPGRFVPTNGMNNEYVDYWTWCGHESPMWPRAEVPVEQAYAALEELIRTHQRPTCVEWVAG